MRGPQGRFVRGVFNGPIAAPGSRATWQPLHRGNAGGIARMSTKAGVPPPRQPDSSRRSCVAPPRSRRGLARCGQQLRTCCATTCWQVVSRPVPWLTWDLRGQAKLVAKQVRELAAELAETSPLRSYVQVSFYLE